MNDKENAIEISNISKHFKVYYDKSSSLKEKVLFWKRNAYEKRQVLTDVSLNVKKGEALGLIGKNGCGKSTLLKLISRIMYPDSGSIQVSGRVSSLIELGAGFHPDMSGRENIYINASIFGMTKKEIDCRLDDIIQFSELGDAIDTPVRTYSSGMYMRLAFSVAINVDADVLLIDEILAVGDANFQAKCFNKLREIKAKGTTIVIVSHSLQQIEQICDRSVWIKDGELFMQGSPREVHPEYMAFMGRSPSRPKAIEAPATKSPEKSSPKPDNTAKSAKENVNIDGSKVKEGRWGNKVIEITSVRLIDESGNEIDSVEVGTGFTIEISYKTNGSVEAPVFGIGVFRNDGLNCYGTNTLIDHQPDMTPKPEGKVLCVLDKVEFLPGAYTVDTAVHAQDGLAFDYIKKAASFTIYSELREAGTAHIEHSWRIN